MQTFRSVLLKRDAMKKGYARRAETFLIFRKMASQRNERTSLIVKRTRCYSSDVLKLHLLCQFGQFFFFKEAQNTNAMSLTS